MTCACNPHSKEKCCTSNKEPCGWIVGADDQVNCFLCCGVIVIIGLLVPIIILYAVVIPNYALLYQSNLKTPVGGSCQLVPKVPTVQCLQYRCSGYFWNGDFPYCSTCGDLCSEYGDDKNHAKNQYGGLQAGYGYAKYATKTDQKYVPIQSKSRPCPYRYRTDDEVNECILMGTSNCTSFNVVLTLPPNDIEQMSKMLKDFKGLKGEQYFKLSEEDPSVKPLIDNATNQVTTPLGVTFVTSFVQKGKTEAETLESHTLWKNALPLTDATVIPRTLIDSNIYDSGTSVNPMTAQKKTSDDNYKSYEKVRSKIVGQQIYKPQVEQSFMGNNAIIPIESNKTYTNCKYVLKQDGTFGILLNPARSITNEIFLHNNAGWGSFVVTGGIFLGMGVAYLCLMGLLMTRGGDRIVFPWFCCPCDIIWCECHCGGSGGGVNKEQEMHKI
jgi:hypothetical protein